MGKPCGVVFVLLFSFAIGSIAFGSEVGNIHFGQVYVHPRIGVEATYDDNIFLLDETKTDDVVFTIRPGIDVDFTRSGKSVHLGYLAEIARYVDNSDYDFVNHIMDAGIDLQFVSGFTFFVGDAFRKTTDRLNYEEEPLIRRTQNTADLKVGYEFTDRLSCDVRYDYMLLDYEDSYTPTGEFRQYSLFNRDENRVTGTLYYRIFAKISLLGQVQYRQIDYDQEMIRSDSDGVSGFLGITGQLGPKVVALVKVGYQDRNYENGGDWNGAVFSVDLVHRTTETLLLTIGASREAVESTYSMANYFTATQGRVGLEKQLGRKVSVLLSGFYASHDYPSNRDDDIWGARAGLRYNIQPWISTTLSYTHEERNSNLKRFDYDDNRVSLGISAVF